MPPRGGPNREGARQGALIVMGDGASIDSLRAPRLVPMAELTLDIGRRAPATPGPTTLTLPDSTVSGLHARIQRAGDRSELFVIHDLGSTNGTFVNGRRIHGPTPLDDGCVLFLGSQVLVFRLYTAAELAAVSEDAAAPLTPVATLSPALALTISKLRRLARSDSEILLLGETGVGKEVFAGRRARAVGAHREAHRRELRRDPARAGRERALRLREGGALDRAGAQDRSGRGGRRRNAVPRRDRRDADRAAVEAAPLPAGPAVLSARLDAGRGGRRPHHRRHQPRRARHGEAPSGGDAGAPRRAADPAAAAARADRGPGATLRLLSPRHDRRAHASSPTPSRRSCCTTGRSTSASC